MSLEQSRQRRFGRIPEALAYSGLSRARFYEWVREHPRLVRKNGRASLVDFALFDELLDALPVAGLKTTTTDD